MPEFNNLETIFESNFVNEDHRLLSFLFFILQNEVENG